MYRYVSQWAIDSETMGEYETKPAICVVFCFVARLRGAREIAKNSMSSVGHLTPETFILSLSVCSKFSRLQSDSPFRLGDNVEHVAYEKTTGSERN